MRYMVFLCSMVYIKILNIACVTIICCLIHADKYQHMIKVISDHSPYYTTITWPELPKIISWLQAHVNDDRVCQPHPFPTARKHTRKSIDLSEIYHCLPGLDSISWSRNGSVLISQPGDYSSLHRDKTEGPEADDLVGLNFPIKVLDQCCNTYWVDDEVLKNDPRTMYYDVHNVDDEWWPMLGQHRTPRACTTVLQNDQAMLINTGEWHYWGNTSTTHERIIMSLRLDNKMKKDHDFQRIHDLLINQ